MIEFVGWASPTFNANNVHRTRAGGQCPAYELVRLKGKALSTEATSYRLEIKWAK